MVKPILIDLYSGCGGFGLGGELAGFHSELAVDIAPELQSAYKLNFQNTKVVLSDVSKMEQSAWKCLLANKPVDGIIGGPPCQGFSRIGKNDTNDPRRSLVYHFFRTVNILRPKFFVMENVEGLLDEKNIAGLQAAIDSLHSAYTVLSPIVVDASDYGAPTKRKRVVVVGYDPAKMNPIDKNDILSNRNRRVSVRQAISDVSNTIKYVKRKDDFGWSRYAVGNMSQYAKEMRQPPPKGLGSVLAIKMNNRKLVSGSFETIHSEAVLARFIDTPQGRVEPVSRYPRLSWNGLCPTLRAGTGSDRGSFQAVRPIHPSEPRVITVREAARLQGFPDWFVFHQTKHHSFRMIGNSVSPIVAKEILTKIKKRLNY